MLGALVFHLSSTGLEGFPFAVVKVRARLLRRTRRPLHTRSVPV